MNPAHLPRSLIILLFLLVGVTFFGATLRTFTPAHAVANATVTLVLTTPSIAPAEVESETPLSTPPGTNAGQVDNDASSSPPPTPIPDPGYADTTGIIALAILMVVVMLVGMAWGGHRTRINQGSNK